METLTGNSHESLMEALSLAIGVIKNYESFIKQRKDLMKEGFCQGHCFTGALPAIHRLVKRSVKTDNQPPIEERKTTSHKTQSYVFGVGEDSVVIKGKSYWPYHITLLMDKHQAMEMVISLLQQIRSQRIGKETLDYSFLGNLRKEENR